MSLFPRRHRFVQAAAAIELFQTAAPVDYDQLCHDLDHAADQGIDP